MSESESINQEKINSEKILTDPDTLKEDKADTTAFLETLHPITGTDRGFAVLTFVLTYLAVDVFNIFTDHHYYGAGVTFYTLLYGISVLGYAKLVRKKIHAEGLFWFAVMGICASSYLWIQHESLIIFNAMFLRLVTLYFTVAVFGAQIEGKTGAFFLLDGFDFLFYIPFSNWKVFWRSVKPRKSNPPWVRSAGKALLGLAVAFPLILVVFCLLSSADVNFNILLTSWLTALGDFFRHYALNGMCKFFLAIPVAMFLFGLMYGSANRKGIDHTKPDVVRTICAGCAVAPRISIYTVMAVFCLLYGMFISLQGSYYLDALKGVLPEGFTYSEYARQGFFELLVITVINLGIILLSALLCQKIKSADGTLKKDRVFCWCSVAISVLTLFLIVTAMTKMFLYIYAYGLTPLRMITSLFMMFLLIIFLLIIVAQFIKIPVTRIAVYVFAIGYVLLSVSNMDVRINRYNQEYHQIQGSLDD